MKKVEVSPSFASPVGTCYSEAAPQEYFTILLPCPVTPGFFQLRQAQDAPWHSRSTVFLASPATRVAMSNVRCRGGDVMSFAQRAISHFMQRKKHCPFFLASPLLSPSERNRACMRRVEREVMPGLHRADLAGCTDGSPAINRTTLKGARWCRPPPWTARISAARICPAVSSSRIR